MEERWVNLRPSKGSLNWIVCFGEVAGEVSGLDAMMMVCKWPCEVYFILSSRVYMCCV